MDSIVKSGKGDSLPLPVLVIGGGVSGSACALRLRSHGIDVHLAEKSVFPRAKVCGCCLGGIGLHCLDQLLLRDWALQNGVATSRWSGSLGGQRIELPLPQGVAISRELLDTRMLQSAAEAGANLLTPALARVDKHDSNSVTATVKFNGLTSRQYEYSVVVIASGLNASGSQRLLPWREKPNGPFGAAFFARSETLPAGTIHMACDDDGYVGLVRLEDDRIDIAAALATGNKAAGSGSAVYRIDRILSRSQLCDWSYHDPTPLMSTPPLRRLRKPGTGRVIAIGDAAGYVEPFTGEGMTWGMMSAIAAADLIAGHSHGDLSLLGDAWCRQHASLLRTKRFACRAVTSLLRSSLARRAVAATISQWPSLAAPLIQHLNRV